MVIKKKINTRCLHYFMFASPKKHRNMAVGFSENNSSAENWTVLNSCLFNPAGFLRFCSFFSRVPFVWITVHRTGYHILQQCRWAKVVSEWLFQKNKLFKYPSNYNIKARGGDFEVFNPFQRIILDRAGQQCHIQLLLLRQRLPLHLHLPQRPLLRQQQRQQELQRKEP